MSQNQLVGRKRAVCDTVNVVEDFTIEWNIQKFAAWAESKEPGYCFNSPNFRFYAPSLRKQLSFGIAVYPKGMVGGGGGTRSSVENDSEIREDNLGIFLVNNSEVGRGSLCEGPSFWKLET